jgi:hypothetical protein
MDERVFSLSDILVDACAVSGLPFDEQLNTLELAWLSLAATVRGTALSVPGGFPAAQARQFKHLGRMALIVRDAIPDLEAERLFQEGDLAAESERLGRETEALESAHADIQSRPVDLNEHEAHRAKLRAHINALHTHIQRWQHRRRTSRRF